MDKTDYVDVQVSIFNHNFAAALNECAPYITKRGKPKRTDWITDEIKMLSREKRTYLREYKRNRSNDILRDQYKQHEKTLRKKIAEAKHEHFTVPYT